MTAKIMLGLREEGEHVFTKSSSFQMKDVEIILKSISFKKEVSETWLPRKSSNSLVLEQSFSFKNWELETNVSFKIPRSHADQFGDGDIEFLSATEGDESRLSANSRCIAELVSRRSKCELDAAAVQLQKAYRSYRTRRNLADCAVVIEELWWKLRDYTSLERSSVSFFNEEKPETAVSRWARARTRAAKVGKGLLKHEKAQKLALQHWLEAIDPRHRYGHNLHLYYDIWFDSESTQPFFYWLDIGDGKEVNLERCSRRKLQIQCIQYLGPEKRKVYEVIVENGKLVYKQSRFLVDTVEGCKWIFVLSTSRNLYVGQKKKGEFQHSSFLSGGATTAAGRLVAKNGILKAIWPYSGHYLPTEENFKEFIEFLAENNVDLTNVKRCSIDDDLYPTYRSSNDLAEDMPKIGAETVSLNNTVDKVKEPSFAFGNGLACKWSTGTGPRIGCVRDYPVDLQSKALEQVNLSPRVSVSPTSNKVPIPSPRPSPGLHLSPRLAYMGIPTPRVSLTLPAFKK